MSKGIVKTTTTQRRRREPGELAGRALAVRNHCMECMGWNAAAVRRCTAPECWLYPYRFGTGGGKDGARSIVTAEATKAAKSG